jgi:hypothetical protein
VLLTSSLHKRQLHFVGIDNVHDLELAQQAKAQGFALTTSVSVNSLASSQAEEIFKAFDAVDTIDFGSNVQAGVTVLLTAVAKGWVSLATLTTKLNTNAAGIFGVEIPSTSNTEVVQLCVCCCPCGMSDCIPVGSFPVIRLIWTGRPAAKARYGLCTDTVLIWMSVLTDVCFVVTVRT